MFNLLSIQVLTLVARPHLYAAVSAPMIFEPIPVLMVLYTGITISACGLIHRCQRHRYKRQY
jgi:hypothetical protein